MIGNNEEAKIGVKLDLDLSNVDSAFGKIQKEITSLGTKAELTMAKLNPKSDMYKSLLGDYEKIYSIQNKISNTRQNDKSLTTANVELRQQLLWLESIKARMSDNIKFAQNNIITQKAQTKEFQNQTAELTRLTDKFGGLSREAQSLRNHYKSLGDKSALGGLAEKLKEIQQQQTIISNLSSKKNAGGILSSVELAQLDTASKKYKDLRGQVADLKVQLNDIPKTNLIMDAGKRAIGYSVLFTAITAVTTAIGANVKAMLEADLASRTLGAVLNTNINQAKGLGASIRELGEIYGGSLKDIDGVALALARAGIAQDKLVKSTELILSLARLTGDTFEISAKAMITYQQVYGDTKSLEELGNILAYVANMSRLSTEDIGTFSNYALSTADSLGVTVNSVSALATAFSVAGVNASTIGTQMRTLFLSLSSDSKAITTLFDTIGVNQKNLLADIGKGGATSENALKGFFKSLKELDNTTFNQLTGEMEKLTGSAFKLVRNNYDNFEKFQNDLQKGVKGQIDNVGMILDGYLPKIESFWNTVLNMGSKWVDSTANLASQAYSFLSLDTATGVLKSYARELELVALQVNDLEKNYQKGVITTEAYIKKKSELGKLEADWINKVKEVSKAYLIETNADIREQIKVKEQYIKEGKDTYEIDKKIFELRQEASKYANIAELDNFKNTGDSAKKATEDIKLFTNEIIALENREVLGEDTTKTIEEFKVKLKEAEDRLKSFNKEANITQDLVLIPEINNDKLVTFLTQQVNTLKEAKKDFTQEQALLNSILAQDNQTILNGTKTVIKQASDLNSDFGKDLTHIMGTSVTEALKMLNAWRVALKTTQATLSADLDSLVSANKGNSPEAKALRDEIDLYSKKDNILEKGIEQTIKLGEVQTKVTKTNIEGGKKEAESIYSILNARKDEALFLQKIEQYKKGIEGTTKGSLEIAQLELSYAKQNLDEALKRKENAKDIAKFRRDYAQAELDVAKAQDAVTNKMLEQKAIAESLKLEEQLVVLNLDTRPYGELLKLEAEAKKIQEQILKGKQNEEQTQVLINNLKSNEIAQARISLNIEREKADLEQNRLDILTKISQAEQYSSISGGSKVDTSYISAGLQVTNTESQFNNIYRKMGETSDETEMMRLINEYHTMEQELINAKITLKERELEISRQLYEVNIQNEGAFGNSINIVGEIGKGLNKLGDAQETYRVESALVEKGVLSREKVEKKHTLSQIDNIGEMAGTFKGYFKEQSAGYKALHKLEQAMHAARMAMMLMELPQIIALTVAKWGEASANATASVTAAGSGDPYTAPARVAVMMGLMAAALIMFGGSGGGGSGGGSSVSYSQAEIDKFNIEAEYTPMIGRLDRQIELLEKIERNGSAGAIKVELASITFEKDYKLLANEFLTDIHNNLEPSWGAGWEARAVNEKQFEDMLGFNLGDLRGKNFHIDKNSLKQDFNLMRLIETINANWDYFHNSGFGVLLDKDWGQAGDPMSMTIAQIGQITNDMQELLHEYTMSLLDSMQDLKDAKEEYISIYEELTDSRIFTDAKLADAFKSFDSLLSSGESYADYIYKEINNLQNLEKFLTNDKIEILLSQDPTNLKAQLDLLDELKRETGLTFQNGARDAIDFLESIKLVSEALVTSRNNINSFVESFMSDTQLLEEQSKKLGVVVATNMEELLAQAVAMSSDSFGLTDGELDYLKASKSFLEKQVEEQKKLQQEKIDAEKELLNTIKSNISTLEGVFSSLKSTIDKLRDSADETDTYSLNKFYESMAETQQLISSLNKNQEMLTQDEYKAIIKSIQDTTNYSTALSQTKNFTSGAEYRYAQLLAATQFEEMGITLNDELDYLKMIEENTRNTVDALTATLVSLQVSITNSMKENSSYFAELAKLMEGKGINSQSATSKLIHDIYTKYDLHKYQTDDSGYKHWENQVASGAIKVSDLESVIKATAEQILSGSSSGGSSSSSGGSSSSSGGGSTSSTADLVNSIYSKYDLHKYQTDDSGYKHWENQVSSGAIKVSDLESVIKATADKILGINSFAVGTPNVPRDMLAQIHQGEIITPKTYSEGIRSGDLMMGDTRRISNSMDNGMKELKNELVAIKEENKKMSLLLIKLTADNSKMLNLERAKA